MSEIIKAIAVTAELTQTPLSKQAIMVMEHDLAAYPVQSVLRALDKCRKELTGRLTLAAIIQRIEANDGRPTANEAWALAIRFFDEQDTVVLTDEISEASSIASDVFRGGDEIGARVAFRDSYERIVARNREAGVSPRWYASLGHDMQRREQAIGQAVARGFLTDKQAALYLPPPMTEKGEAIAGLLTGGEVRTKDPEIMRRFEQLKAILRGERNG